MPAATYLLKLARMLIACSMFVTLLASAQTVSGRQGFCVHADGINLPLGKFLLIRKGNQLGALRLTQITADVKAVPRAGEWIGTVAYESYSTEDGSSFTSSSARKISDKMEFGRIKGVGFHYSWQSGNMTAKVGSWKFHFFDQDGMWMSSYDFWNGVEHDSGLEFAPTNATEINQVNPNDSRLHWYRRDPDTNIPCPVLVPN